MPANPDSQILPLILQEVQESRKDTAKYLEKQAKLEQELRDHKQDTEVHQRPPCRLALATEKKINWVLCTAFATMLGALAFLAKAAYGKLFP